MTKMNNNEGPWEHLAERAVAAAEKLASAGHRIASEMEMARSYRTATAHNAQVAKSGSSNPFVSCGLCGGLLTHHGEPHDCKKFQKERTERNERVAALR